MLVGGTAQYRRDTLRRNKPSSVRFLAPILVLSVAACSSSDPWKPGEEAPDAGAAIEAATTAPDRSPAASPEAGAQPVRPDGTPFATGCGSAPLALTRFSAAQRTTSEGRVFTGWGGAASPDQARRPPVILIHGNGGSADDWTSFRTQLCKAGYSDQEIWAITFQNNDCSGSCTNGSNTQHATELDKLVELVRGYTGALKVSLVAISMGVPTTRYYIKDLDGLKRNEVALAYLVSGPNHGLEACDYPGAGYVNVACAELDEAARASGWLHDLNTPDETPDGQGDGVAADKTIVYRTVSYTEDPFFPDSYVSSPELEGADNLVLPGSTHAAIDLNDLLSYLKKVE